MSKVVARELATALMQAKSDQEDLAVAVIKNERDYSKGHWPSDFETNCFHCA